MGKLILIFVLAFSLLSFVACENFDDSDDDGIVIEEENVRKNAYYNLWTVSYLLVYLFILIFFLGTT